MQVHNDFLDAVDEVQRRLVDWRGGEKVSKRIPEEIWADIVCLAGQFGPSLVSRTLGLSYRCLMKRMPVQLALASASPPAFKEWIAPVAASIEQCSVELESHRGAKLRIEMNGVSPSALATLIREFVG